MKRQSWLTWFKKAWNEESWEREIKVCTVLFLARPHGVYATSRSIAVSHWWPFDFTEHREIP
jgi:hypothetical protein